MAESKIRAELKRLANSPFVDNISKQVTVYEQKVKRLVNDFDSRSRTAREKSKTHLDKLATQLKRTRGDVEKRIATLWTHEGVRLNRSVNDLVNYIKTMAKAEGLVKPVAATAKKRASAGAKSSSGKKTTKSKRVSTKAAPATHA